MQVSVNPHAGAVPPTPTTSLRVQDSILVSFPPISANFTGDYDEIAIEPCSIKSSNSHMTTDVKSFDKNNVITDESDNRPDITGSSNYYFTLTPVYRYMLPSLRLE